jgi:hypothetical protein
MEPWAHRPWLFPPPLAYKAIGSMYAFFNRPALHGISPFLGHIDFAKNFH